jgi:hypothetical protein
VKTLKIWFFTEKHIPQQLEKARGLQRGAIPVRHDGEAVCVGIHERMMPAWMFGKVRFQPAVVDQIADVHRSPCSANERHAV